MEPGPDDKGTMFRAASGCIEILKLPQVSDSDSTWDYRAPQGAWMGIETGDVDSWYERVLEKGLPIREELMNQEWGHRSFRLVDPDGIEIYVFSKLE